jgi:hypothetical protein
VASYKGSGVILRKIIEIFEADQPGLDWTTADEPGPDGTTSFAIALGKKFTNIVVEFLRIGIGESRVLNTAAEKERERSKNKKDIYVEKW